MHDSVRRVARVSCLLVAAIATTMLSGCSLQRLTVNQTADVLYAGQPALEREGDPQFAREAFPASLKTIETFLLSSPDNEKMLEMLAKGYFSYAFGFLEWDLERGRFELAEEEDLREMNRRAVLHYLRSRDYGFMLLDMPQLEAAARANDIEVLEAELAKVSAEDVAGLFWAGYGWGSAINLSQSDTSMVASIATVEAIMKRVEQLDDDYFYAGVHLFFGIFYASRPAMFGGDPAKAKHHFDIAIERHGEYNMMIHYLMARYYAPTQQDRALFVSTMERVANHQDTDHPNVRLNNEIARERARFWLRRVDELIYE